MSLLREFNYGRVSELQTLTTLREFTLVASDDKVKEISPGDSIMYGCLMGYLDPPYALLKEI